MHGERVKYLFTLLFHGYKLRKITGMWQRAYKHVGLTFMIDKQNN